jgi:hypothetical protein
MPEEPEKNKEPDYWFIIQIPSSKMLDPLLLYLPGRVLSAAR